MSNARESRQEAADIARDLRNKLASALALVERFPSMSPVETQIGSDGPPVLAADVARFIDARKARERFFPRSLFADPAWDMLLELYLAVLENRRLGTNGLCFAAAVPATTALRWIGNLEAEGLIDRSSDHLDGRRVFVSLSVKGLGAMEAYFKSNPFPSAQAVVTT